MLGALAVASIAAAYMLPSCTSRQGDDDSGFARKVSSLNNLVEHLLDKGQVEKIAMEPNVLTIIVLKPGAPGLPRRTSGRDRGNLLTVSDILVKEWLRNLACGSTDPLLALGKMC
jgi:hypothetical protein